MLPLAATPEFQAMFRADLAALRARAGEALARLQIEPDNPDAQVEFANALHGLKGLAGMTAAGPLSRTVAVLERVGDLGAKLCRGNDEPGARALFAACHGPGGELSALLELTARGEGDAPATKEAALRLCEALTARWPALAAPAETLPEPAPPGPETGLLPVAAGAPPGPVADLPVTDPAAEADVLAFLHELGVEPPSPPPPDVQAVLSETTLVQAASSAAAGPAPAEDGVDAEMLQYFVPETAEYCDGIEKALAEMGELGPGQEDQGEPRLAFLRFWHTIKGAANSIGLSALGSLSHAVEDAFEENSPLVWEEKRRIGLAATALVRDFLRDCASDAVPAVPTLPVNALIAHFENLRRNANARAPQAPPPAVSPGAVPPPAPLPSLPAVPDEAAFEAPGARVDPATLDALMDLVGELSVSRNRLLAKVQTFTALQGEMESCKNRLLRVVGNFQERHEYSALAANGNKPGHGRGQGGGSRSPHRPAGFGELEFDAYDEVNLLSRALMEIGADTGELIDQSRRFFTTFTEDSDQFRKVSTKLQETITQVRMVPLNGLFRRLRRVVADAANTENKEVAWETEGGDTRLDKVVVESLFGPLLHLVRNAVGHGVESPAAREAAGKPRAGRLRLRATQKSGQAMIELQDDGGGLDFGAIRERALATGLLTAEEAASAEEKHLVGLIFKPGFSTRDASACNAVSGRGIGMDAVLQQITRLNGTIDVESRPGRGCTLTLKLPVTLAIGQAMFVRVGAQTFALPLAFVERLAPCSPETIQTDEDGQESLPVTALEGNNVPLMHLEDLLGLPRSGDARPRPSDHGSDEAPARPLAVIARVADQRVAFPVGAVLRRGDIVTKNLGPLLAAHPCFAGATIDHDGRVVLILDVPRLAQDFFARRGVFALVGARVAAFVPEPAAPVKLAVLIVDDSLSVRKVSEKHVTELGYEAVTATDGADALAKMAARRFACVLTDLEMPRMDGFELLTELRGQPSTRNLPVIVVTSRQADKHRQRASSLGATDYLMKPFSKDQLAAKLTACLEAAAPVAQAA